MGAHEGLTLCAGMRDGLRALRCGFSGQRDQREGRERRGLVILMFAWVKRLAGLLYPGEVCPLSAHP